ncbi:SusC/RagA family TonB-linked outer membrane protein [Bacteroides thetaiotaomicron]|uniref:TonB-dependent receptor n=1 Tax=Bacteroides thetaiotaomicron TaxID=818 RepID=A0AAW4Z864_BACT4|nr:TonB-dependent receptor [Bacteroides thetaiotaomicron]MCE9236880.1 TonB-dependent receptor [Bacteroides thetaiotaomicron]MCE9266028.1 TonB-dependent receptor [Bacteroides thetaiotaomicron]MCE9275565.1 TonB-dependent receptor [Bacteroides thetaiotaomicron]MCE9293441.1 TonB-dependent receptor [Bacteroides thetaiotaomicron]
MKNSKQVMVWFVGTDIIRRLIFFILLFFLTTDIYAQNKNISGRVIDFAGEPVIGASVLVNGTSNGTISDIDGKFSLFNVPAKGTITVTYIGYKKQVVSVAGNTVFKITLQEDTETLDEVVVVGYGVQKKSDVTGAMASVGTEQLTARPVNNAFEALQGKAAGVDITTNERPGSVGEIRIRGNRSLTASNDPLYVVDGVPLMSASAIETLNPRDIESIDVLKDASATAIYGSRGANGVIIVTTKQGKTGKLTLDYSGTLTVSNLVDRAPAMSAGDFVRLRRWAAYNLDPETYAHPNSPTKENDMLIFDSPLDGQTSRNNVLNGWTNGSWDPSNIVNTDWTNFVTQTSLSHEHTLSASGGTDKMSAYGSFGYLSNKGTQKGQWFDRYTAKLSVNVTPVKWFSMSGSVNVSWSEQDYGMSTLGGRSGSVPDAIYGAAKSIYNIAVPYDVEGNIVINPGGENGVYTIMDEWNRSTQQSQTMRALGNFSATLDFGEMWQPLKGVRYKINFGPDFRHWREGVYIDGTSAHKINSDGSEGVNYARLKNRRDFSWTLDNMITFDRNFAEKHKVGLTLLQTASVWDVEESSMSANKIAKSSFLWNAFGSIDLTNTDHKASMSSGITERQLTSYMIRLNYGFNERYLLTVSGRWDGASQLAEGHKWDFFPSAALAWRINQEDFMKSIRWIDNLKVRLGVGTTGNAAVSPYATKGDITSIYLPFNGIDNLLGYTTNEPYYMKDQLTMANTTLGWEKTTQYNFGIDFGVLNNRISGSIDAYWSRTKDLLMKANIPTLTGFPSTYANIGETSNHGIEITLNAIPIDLKCGFMWETNFNIAYQKDKIEKLAYGKNDMVDNAWFIGESLAVHYGFDNDGIWQNTPEDCAEMEKWNANGYTFTPGNVRPKDQNGDYKMDINDRVVLGNKNPNWTMGWNNNFSYKGIDLGISMLGRMGYMVSTGGEALTSHSNQKDISYWTPDNTNAEFQKPILAQATSGSGDDFSSLLGFKKASFVKVRNISLGYNFPKKLYTKAGLSRLKMYAQVVNPFSIHQSIDWYDLDVNKTYFNRSFVFGLEVSF